MEVAKLLFFITLILCWTGQVLSWSDGNDTRCICSPNGIRGDRGPEGPKGENGDTGRSGRRGQKGGIGFRGMKGDAGITGPAGEKGSKGEKGSCDHQETHVPIRNSRHVDPLSPRGETGKPGQKGAKGKCGEPGMTGDKGDKGPHGHNGSTGQPGQRGGHGEKGPKGYPGSKGEPGLKGSRGAPGAHGLKGPPGPRGQKLCQDNFNTLVQDLQSHLSTELGRMRASLYCGDYSSKWRPVFRIDMTDTTISCDWCEDKLKKYDNPITNQAAYGGNDCAPHNFSIRGDYTHVCGYVRGYQSGTTKAFIGGNIADHYADGVLITSGNRSNHLWTYAVSTSKERLCSPITNVNNTLDFVEDHYYCESGLTNTAWEDPLWDGIGRVTHGNTRYQNHGWFHRQVNKTSDSIEVRWCATPGNGAVITDILEIWVQ